MTNVAVFLLCIAVSSVGLQKLGTMYSEPTNGTKKEVVLGHRVGPAGQVMLVTK